MPRDAYVFLLLLAALIGLRLVDLPPGVRFVLFSLIVVGQVALVAYGLSQPLRGKKRRPD